MERGWIMAQTIPVVEYPGQVQQFDMGSADISASTTAVLPGVWDCENSMDKGLLVTIAGNGTASIGIDVGDVSGTNFYRRVQAYATGLTKSSGNDGKVYIRLDPQMVCESVRVWVQETGGSSDVNVAVLAVGSVSNLP
jgi:hypothetical protein